MPTTFEFDIEVTSELNIETFINDENDLTLDVTVEINYELQ